MRVERVLVYTGKEDWIENTLKNSYIQKDKPFKCTNGSITLESEEVMEDE